MTEQENPSAAEPVPAGVQQDVEPVPAQGGEVSHEYHNVAEGVEARVMTDEERKNRSAETEESAESTESKES